MYKEKRAKCNEKWKEGKLNSGKKNIIMSKMRSKYKCQRRIDSNENVIRGIEERQKSSQENKNDTKKKF